MNKIASSPARLRTAKGAEQNFREPADTDEARRRRRSSTNRILTILKAALNAAYRNGKAPADDAWRRVRPFPKAETPKLRYLQRSEEHTSELQSLMRISYAVFCLKKKKKYMIQSK